MSGKRLLGLAGAAAALIGIAVPAVSFEFASEQPARSVSATPTSAPGVPGDVLSTSPAGLAGSATSSPTADMTAAAVEGNEVDPQYRSPALCGEDDTPETGIQGNVSLEDQQSGRSARGYNCGLALVGYVGGGAGALAVVDDCAYVARNNGISVIDASDPANPVEVTVLPTKVSSENMHARRSGDRAVLVAATTPAGDADVPLTGSLLAVYDVSDDCAAPMFKGYVRYKGSQSPTSTEAVHNSYLTPDVTHVVGSMPLTIVDITNLEDPTTWIVDDFQCDVERQIYPEESIAPGVCGTLQPADTQLLLVPHQVAHVAEMRPCGVPASRNGDRHGHGHGLGQAETCGGGIPDRMYVGGQLDYAPREEYMRILDTSVWPPRVISEFPGSGHTITWMTINGRDYLLHGGELGGPGAACVPQRQLDRPVSLDLSGDNFDYRPLNPRPYITDITDETAPRTLASLDLAINRPDPAMCAAQVQSGQSAAPHWHNVDDINDTHFALLSQTSAGLRMWDVRDPAAPTEIAYFNPGSSSTTPYFNAATGNVYVSAGDGFWVLEIEPQVRAALGLAPPPGGFRYPMGRPTIPSTTTDPDGARAVAVYRTQAALQLFCQLALRTWQTSVGWRTGGAFLG